jgi:hypothetical protein
VCTVYEEGGGREGGGGGLFQFFLIFRELIPPLSMHKDCIQIKFLKIFTIANKSF